MADIDLDIGLKIDQSALNSLKQQLDSLGKSSKINLAVVVDKKAIDEVKKSLDDIGKKAINIKLDIDKSSLANITKQIKDAIAAGTAGTAAAAKTSGASGMAGVSAAAASASATQKPPTPAQILSADTKKYVADAKKEQELIRQATAIIVQAREDARKALEIQDRKDADRERSLRQQKELDDNQKTRDARQQLQKTKDEGKLAVQTQKDNTTLQVESKKAASKDLQTTTQAATAVTVQAGHDATKITTTQMTNDSKVVQTVIRDSGETLRTQMAQDGQNQRQAANLTFRRQVLAWKRQQAEAQNEINKIYQSATVFYQAANAGVRLGIPFAGEVAQIGSTIQALAPGLAKTKVGGVKLGAEKAIGIATGIGVGVSAITVGKEVVDSSLKSYGELETSMMRIENLTGTSSRELGVFKKQIESLSLSTGRSQNELAQGLYFIASSGFKGADAFKVLEASTKASVAGMGDIVTVADVATTVMNAYGISADQSALVTDKLIAAVREGKAEPIQFARSLGQVLPVARQAGISLEETFGALSAMTLQTGNASQAVTSLKQLLQSVSAPSEEAKKTLDLIYGAKAGSGEGVVAVKMKLQTEGLEATLNDIFQKTGGNTQMLDSIFGNIRGLVGVLQLAEGNFKKFGEITERMYQAQNLTNEGAEKASKTVENSLARLDASFDNLKLKLGALAAPIIIPLIIKLSGSIGTIGKATESVIGAFGGDFSKGQEWADEVIQKYKGFNLLNLSPMTLQRLFMDESSFMEYSYAQTMIALLKSKKLYKTPILPAPEMTPAFEEDRTRIDAKAGTRISTPGFMGGKPGSMIDLNTLAEEYRKQVKKALAAQDEADNSALAINTAVANSVATSVDNITKQGEQYTDFFDKYQDIVDQVDKTSNMGRVWTSTGKQITSKALAEEDKRIKDLQLQVKIDEINRKNRQSRGVTDNLADNREELRANELKRLKDERTKRGDITYQTEEQKNALEAQAKALEAYNRQTFDLFKTQFNDAIKGAATDTETLNALLRDGGKLLGAFAEAAGLFKSSGFVLSVGEAALQMKYLYDAATGKRLTGDAAVKGLESYGKALLEFRNNIRDLEKYISGKEVMTKEIAIQYKLITPTMTREQREGMGSITRKQDQELKDLQENPGRALLEKITGGGLPSNLAETAVTLGIQIGKVSAQEEIENYTKKLQEAADAKDMAVKIGAVLVDKGIGLDVALSGEEGLLEAAQKKRRQIKIPELFVEADTFNLEKLRANLDEKVGTQQFNPVAKVTVDLSAAVINDSSLTSQIQAAVDDAIRRVNFFKVWGGKLPNEENKAAGGDITKSGYYLVGEVGPETVWLPRGSHVTTASDTTRWLASRETYRPYGNSNLMTTSMVTTIKVDARGAEQPKRVKEAAQRGVMSAITASAASRRAREMGAL